VAEVIGWIGRAAWDDRFSFSEMRARSSYQTPSMEFRSEGAGE
jgi:hypothetical protein